MKRILLLLILMLPVLVSAEIGKVKFSVPLAIDQPFGLALDNDMLLLGPCNRSSLSILYQSEKDHRFPTIALCSSLGHCQG